MGITMENILEYRKQYPNDSCAFSEPGPGVLIRNNATCKSYISPWNESSETFRDRLKRSLEAGRNLFYEEWKPFEYEEDCLY